MFKLDRILNLIKKFIPQQLFSLCQPFYHRLLAKLSAFIYGYPSNKMLVIGVTGTAGKSSTCYFIAQILQTAGYKVGMTTTTLFKIGAKEWLNDKKMTMLGRFQTQKLLKQMVKKRCDAVIIETSSQGIEQFRHLGINYDILVLTNLYPEHLEAHRGFENYKQAKGKLFEYFGTLKHKKLIINNQQLTIKKTTMVNLDDENAEYFLGFKADEKCTFGKKQETRNKKQIIANYQLPITNLILADDVKIEDGKIEFIIYNLPAVARENSEAKAGSLFIIHLLGNYNLYNVLAAITVARALDIDLETIKSTVSCLKPLPGRLEFIENNLDIKIIVDYAFEPRALEKLYEVVKEMLYNKIIHVLGSAGGGRDKSRRPVLGKIAAENADIIIITNEDPYDEEPMEIINQVASGVQLTINNQQLTKVYKILDRREAIRKALSLAKSGDLVLITGKGAEQAICVKGGKMIPWDDGKVVREELKQLTCSTKTVLFDSKTQTCRVDS